MQKTGLVMLYFLLYHASRTWGKYYAKAVAEINASSVSATEKAAAIALLNQVSEIAGILKIITGY
jgi:hypothetical protein